MFQVESGVQQASLATKQTASQECPEALPSHYWLRHIASAWLGDLQDLRMQWAKFAARNDVVGAQGKGSVIQFSSKPSGLAAST